MDFTGVIIATLLIGGVGLFVGIFLGIAGLKFQVEVDKKEEKVLEVLPGNNCGACGYPGCSGLAAAIATVMMSCTTAAHAQTTGNTKYIYCQDDTNTTVYTLNEDGKTLTRKVKYEYKRNETGQVIEKKAYRWDACREIWKPAYLLTVTPGISETKLSYTEWNAKKSAFNDNKQETIYREDCNTNLLADTQNKK